MKRRIIAATLVCMAVVAGVAGAARAETVDLLLVLAADVSRSIDDDEFNLQRKGYAQRAHRSRGAERDYRRKAPRDRGHVGRMVRRGRAEYRHRLDRRARRGKRRRRSPRRLYRRRVRSSAAPRSAPRSISLPNGCRPPPADAERRVIDVSGDGTSNSGRAVTEARDEAVAAGITINGLAIANTPAAARDTRSTPSPPADCRSIIRKT